jgi:hypothetical protein
MQDRWSTTKDPCFSGSPANSILTCLYSIVMTSVSRVQTIATRRHNSSGSVLTVFLLLLINIQININIHRRNEGEVPEQQVKANRFGIGAGQS